MSNDIPSADVCTAVPAPCHVPTLGRGTPKNGRLVYFGAGGAWPLARSRGFINSLSSLSLCHVLLQLKCPELESPSLRWHMVALGIAKARHCWRNTPSILRGAADALLSLPRTLLAPLLGARAESDTISPLRHRLCCCTGRMKESFKPQRA